jgi:hypothetical protein
VEFDKSIGPGYWNVKDSTLLDDVAFSLMCDDIKKRNGDYRNQAFFKYHKDGFPYNKYYERAKIIIRNYKIKKICTNVVNVENYLV